MARAGARSAAIGIALFALVLVSCSEDDGPSAVVPSSAFPDDTAATGGSGPTATAPLPTGPTGIVPTGASGDASFAGQAAVNLTGDVRTSKVLPELASSVYGPPPAAMAIVWTARGADATTLGIGGLTFRGTRPTAATLTLTLSVTNEGRFSSFASSAGECSITIGVASAAELSGAFTCSDLVGADGEVVDATGSFSARA